MPSRRLRQLIAAFFIVTFFATAPILLLYTAGYRYNWKRGTLQQTGSLSIQPLPRTATIALDGVVQTAPRSSGTLRVTNLLPGTYRVTVSAPNYFAWEKVLTVSSATTTFVNHVILFPVSPPIDLALPSTPVVTAALPSPTGQWIAYQTTDHLWAWNTRTESAFDLGALTAEWAPLAWSPIGSQLLVGTAGQFALVSAESTSSTPLLLQTLFPAGSRPQTAHWLGDTNYLISGLTTAGDVYQLNVITREYRRLAHLSPALGRVAASDVRVIGSDILLVQKNAGGLAVASLPIGADTTDTPTPLLQLPGTSVVRIEPQANGTIAIIDTAGQQLWLLASDKKTVLLNAPGTHITWSPDQTELVTWNSVELWRHRADGSQSELITRYGTPITAVAWIPRTEYIALVVGDALTITELDGRDKRNTIVPVERGVRGAVTASGDGRKLFYFGTGETGDGHLFTLLLQE